MSGARWRPSVWLMDSAARRLGADRPDWSAAMLAEAELCEPGGARLRWALGCWIASFRAGGGGGWLGYGAALAGGLAAMATYEWRADEGRVTVLLIGAIALGLGVLRPRLALLSGALVGLVVTGVIGFEAVSGVQPAYEARAQTLAQGMAWLVLLVPALAAAVLGGAIGRRLRAVATRP